MDEQKKDASIFYQMGTHFLKIIILETICISTELNLWENQNVTIQ